MLPRDERVVAQADVVIVLPAYCDNPYIVGQQFTITLIQAALQQRAVIDAAHDHDIEVERHTATISCSGRNFSIVAFAGFVQQCMRKV
jgi:hypothetical protein